jgi:hypothetical protein
MKLEVNGYTAYLDEEESIEWSPSLVIELIDGFTGNQPIGKVRIEFENDKEIRPKKKPVITPSGLYCFNNIQPGNYTLLINSDYYFHEKRKDILIESDEDEAVATKPKKEMFTLIPNSNYPFPEGMPLFIGKVRSNEGPIPGVSVEADILDFVCFAEQEYADFLSENPDAEPILEPYIDRNDVKICIYPAEITDDDKTALEQAYLKLTEDNPQLLRGRALLSFKEYFDYLSKYFLKKDVLKKYRNDENGRLCIAIGDITDQDKRFLGDQAVLALEKKAKPSNKACYTYKQYTEFIKIYLVAGKEPAGSEKIKDSKICFDLKEIDVAEDQPDKFPPQSYEELRKIAAIKTRTNSKGEFILFPKFLGKTSGKLSITLQKDMQKKGVIIVSVKENESNYLEIPWP